MQLKFPEHFRWGTSTAFAQIETASEHNWKGVESKDGYLFERTSDHELRRMEDVAHIARFGSIYRCGVDWARLQTEPFAPFTPEVVAEYLHFFVALREKGVEIMLVLHHFAHPIWMEKKGGWTKEDAIDYYVDYSRRCIHHFGELVSWWNTFNEPNVYALNGYLLKNFPPFKRSLSLANRVLRHMGQAHDIIYDLLKEKDPDAPVGISFNTCWFAGKGLGRIPAALIDYWFHRKAARPFEKVDFWGLSYYAYIPFTPMAVTEIDRPGKLAQMGLAHDKMWAYRPDGLERNLQRFWKRYRKPIMVTENGICTDDPRRRVQAIKDYLQVCHDAIASGIDLQAYIHWSTFDNFEWNLGPTYRFGLLRLDMDTKERLNTAAADYYEAVCQHNALEI